MREIPKHERYPEKYALISQNISELRRVSTQVDTANQTEIERCKQLATTLQSILTLDNGTYLGYGLSARQLKELEGQNSPRLCVIIFPEVRVKNVVKKELTIYKMLNPQILKQSQPWKFRGEGCLSFPNQYYNTPRFYHAEVGFVDLNTLAPRVVEFFGTEAVVLQHEIDHQDGKIFIDKALIPIVSKEKIGANEPCPECAKNGKHIKWKKCTEHNPD